MNPHEIASATDLNDISNNIAEDIASMVEVANEAEEKIKQVCWLGSEARRRVVEIADRVQKMNEEKDTEIARLTKELAATKAAQPSKEPSAFPAWDKIECELSNDFFGDESHREYGKVEAVLHGFFGAGDGYVAAGHLWDALEKLTSQKFYRNASIRIDPSHLFFWDYCARKWWSADSLYTAVVLAIYEIYKEHKRRQ